jgi:hypothetical protein
MSLKRCPIECRLETVRPDKEVFGDTEWIFCA